MSVRTPERGTPNQVLLFRVFKRLRPLSRPLGGEGHEPQQKHQSLAPTLPVWLVRPILGGSTPLAPPSHRPGVSQVSLWQREGKFIQDSKRMMSTRHMPDDHQGVDWIPPGHFGWALRLMKEIVAQKREAGTRFRTLKETLVGSASAASPTPAEATTAAAAQTDGDAGAVPRVQRLISDGLQLCRCSLKVIV
jgi:hypothetical protein